MDLKKTVVYVCVKEGKEGRREQGRDREKLLLSFKKRSCHLLQHDVPGRHYK
jgi:hypothetical protein